MFRALSITELCQSLGVSKGVLLREIKAGKLPAKRIGKRLLIMENDFRVYLENTAAEPVKHASDG